MGTELNSKISAEAGDFIVYTKTTNLLFLSFSRSSVMPFAVANFASAPGLQVQYNTTDARVLAEWHEMLCRMIGDGLFDSLRSSVRAGHFPYPAGGEHLRQYVKRLI